MSLLKKNYQARQREPHVPERGPHRCVLPAAAARRRQIGAAAAQGGALGRPGASWWVCLERDHTNTLVFSSPSLAVAAAFRGGESSTLVTCSAAVVAAVCK